MNASPNPRNSHLTPRVETNRNCLLIELSLAWPGSGHMQFPFGCFINCQTMQGDEMRSCFHFATHIPYPKILVKMVVSPLFVKNYKQDFSLNWYLQATTRFRLSNLRTILTKVNRNYKTEDPKTEPCSADT